MGASWRGLLAVTALLAIAQPRAALSADPKAPAGRDPGGIAVAIIGSGLDYRRPEVAQRLARDGEGEPIGWDFADNDARPFSEADRDGSLAGIVLGEGQTTRLILARVAANRQDQLAMALRLVDSTPAPVVVLAADGDGRIAYADLAEAARHLPQLLIVVPERLVTGKPTRTETEAVAGLIVASADPAGRSADVAVPLVARAGTPLDAALKSRPARDDLAAARVAALAARILAAAPSLRGGALRARILGFARPSDAAQSAISDIDRIYWLE